MAFITLHKTILAVVIMFALMSMFGAGFTMLQDDHGTMSYCPFMDTASSMCQMSIMEHISKWQQLFTFVPRGESSLFYLAALIILCISPFTRLACKDPSLLQLQFSLFLNSRKPEIKLFNHLLISFSQGILNSRIYV